MLRPPVRSKDDRGRPRQAQSAVAGERRVSRGRRWTSIRCVSELISAFFLGLCIEANLTASERGRKYAIFARLNGPLWAHANETQCLSSNRLSGADRKLLARREIDGYDPATTCLGVARRSLPLIVRNRR